MPPPLLLLLLLLPTLDAAASFVAADTTVERSIHFENPIPSRTGVGYSEGQLEEAAAAVCEREREPIVSLPVSLSLSISLTLSRSPLPLHTAARTHRLCEERDSFQSLLAAGRAFAFWGPRETRTGKPPTTAPMGILAPPMDLLLLLLLIIASALALAFVEGGRPVHTCNTRTSAPL